MRGIACLAALLATVGVAPRSSRAGDKPDLVPAPAWTDTVAVDAAAPARIDRGKERLLIDVQLRVGPNVRDRSLRFVERVASPEGLDRVSPIAIDFDPSFQQLQIHHVRLWREGTSIDAYSAADVRFLDVEDELGSRLLLGTRRMMIMVPDVRVGDTVDLAYTLSGRNPIFAGHVVDNVQLGARSAARVRARIRVEPGSRPVDVKVRGEAPAPERREREGAIEYAWDILGGPPVEDEDRVPSWFEPYPVASISDFRDWADVVAWALPLYAPITPSPAMTAAMEAWRGKPPAERALAALRFVQDDIRYLGLELGVNSHRPHEPGEVLAKRFGDCKDKSYLLVTMLRAMGIDAHVALVDTERRGRVTAMPPSPLAFDHVIVRAEVEGRVYWVDPTWSFQGGTLATQADRPYQRALVVKPGATSFEEIPERIPDGPLFEIHEHYRVARDGTASLLVKTIHRHLDADEARARWTRDPPEQLGKRYLDFYASKHPTIRQVRPPTVVDDRQRNEVTVDETYDMAAFWKDDRARLNPHTVVGHLEPPYVRQRRMPLDLPHPTHIVHRIDIDLPVPFTIEPVDGAIDRGGIRYRGHIEQKGLVVSMRHELATKVADLDAAEVGRHIEALTAMDDTLYYELEDAPPGPNDASSSGAGALFVVTIIVVVGVWMFAVRLRRPSPPRINWGHGEQATSAIEIARADDLDAAGARTRCSCGGSRSRASTDIPPQDVRLGDLQLLSARFRCERCGSAQFLYFRATS